MKKFFMILILKGITGELIDFKEYKDKVILVVNTGKLLWFYKSIR